MYLDYLENLNQQWARLSTLEEYEIATVNDYYEFSEWVRLMTDVKREVGSYCEAHELYEDVREVILSKIKTP